VETQLRCEEGQKFSLTVWKWELLQFMELGVFCSSESPFC